MLAGLSVAMLVLPHPLQVGGWWYTLPLLSPAAGVYYWRNATRQEEVRALTIWLYAHCVR
jgi:hypothetical protein